MGSPLLPSSLIFEKCEKSVAVPDMAPEPTKPHNFQEHTSGAPMRLFFPPWFWACLWRAIESTLRRSPREHASVYARGLSRGGRRRVRCRCLWVLGGSWVEIWVRERVRGFSLATGKWGFVSFYLWLYSFIYRTGGTYTRSRSFLSEPCEELWSG